MLNLCDNLSELVRKKYLKHELSDLLVKAYKSAKLDKRGFVNSRVVNKERLAYCLAYALINNKPLNVVKDYSLLVKDKKSVG